MHSLPRILLFAAVITAARADPAALEFTQVSSSAPHGGQSKIQMLIQGPRFNAMFIENSAPVPPAGCYIVGSAGGKIFIVSPATHAYAPFDRERMEGMSQKAGAAMDHARQQEQSHGVTRSVENFKLEKLLDEPGPTMFGYPTRHYRYTISYQDVMVYAQHPKPIKTTIEESDEFWSTNALGNVDDMAQAFSGQPSGPSAGEGADKVREARMAMAKHGLMLKSIEIHKSSMSGMPGMGMMMAIGRLGRGGRGGGSTTTREVVALSQVQPPRTAFQVPPDYQETDMMTLFTAAAGGMPDLNAMSGGHANQPPAMPDLNQQGN